MNNIQKAFKSKAKHGLRMAIGGVVGEEEAPEQRAYGSDVSGALPGQAGFNPAMQMDSTGTQSGQWGFNPDLVAPPQLQQSQTPQDRAKIGFNAPAGMQNGPLGVRNMARLSALSNHRPLALADGGIVGADGLTDAQRTKKNAALGNLGMSTAAAPAPAPAPATAPAPRAVAPAPVLPAPSPDIGGAVNSIRERQRILGNLATGGVVGAKTFEFEGKGTGTSDDIPVKVAGNQINVSDGEKAVVLPAKTAQNPQALDMIEDVIQQSNGGRPPTRGLRNGGNYNLGGFVDDYGNLQQPNKFQKAVPNEILRQQVNNAAPGAQLLPNQTTAMAEQATANRPAPTTAAKPAGLMKNLGRAAQVAGVVSNGIDMVNAEAPAEQVAAAIKGGSMAVGPWTGAAVNLVDEAVNYATGGKHNLATGLDAGARWLSNNMPGMKGDYMLPDNLRPGAAPTAQAQAQEQAQHLSLPTAPQMSVDPSRSVPGIERPQMSTPENYVAPPAENPNIRSLRDAGVRGGMAGNNGWGNGVETGNHTEVRRDGGGRAYVATPNEGIRTIQTVNGAVYAGRDKNGQLNVVSNLDNTDAQNEAGRVKEAGRMTKDLARQVQTFDKLRADSLMESNDPRDRVMGLAQAQQQILQQQNRNHATDTEAKTADAKEGRGIQRATLAQTDDHFNRTQTAAETTARAKLAETNLADADKLVEDSGYKGDDLVGFRDAIRMNAFGGKQLPDGTILPTAADLEKMSPGQRRKLLPAFKAAYEYAKTVNGASISGTSAEFPELQKERKMAPSDIATDRDSLIGLPQWRGKDGKIGVADYLDAKFFDPRISDTMYDFNGGRTVRASAIKGRMGPLGSNDMSALRKKQLQDAGAK